MAVIEDCFELSEHDIQRNRVLVAEQGLLSGRSGSPREEQARQAARARTRDLEFAWASFLSHAMQQGAIPKQRPAPADARDPRPLQQHLALVPAQRHRRADRIAEFFTERTLALLGVAPGCRRRARAAA